MLSLTKYIYLVLFKYLCTYSIQYPAFPTESLVLFILFLLVDDQTKIKESVLVCVNCHSLLLSVEDGAKPGSSLSRAALSLTQLRPGQRSAWLSSVPDSAQPDSSLSRTALSLTHLGPGRHSAWLISLPGQWEKWTQRCPRQCWRKKKGIIYCIFANSQKLSKKFCHLTKPENLVTMFFNPFVTRKNLLSRIFAKNFRSDDP